MLSEYLAHIEAEGKAANTIAAYRADLAAFEPTPAGVRRFVAALLRADLAVSSINRKLASARAYCRWLAARGADLGQWEVALAPASNEPWTPPEGLDATVVARLLAFKEYGPLALRDRAVLRLLADVGCKASELTDLDLGDVAGRAVLLADGTRRVRDVPLAEATWDAVVAYIDHGRPELARLAAEGERALFLNHRGGRLTRQGLHILLHKRCAQVGVADVSPADLRHTAAERLAAGDLAEAQRLLGHAHHTTTRAYRSVLRKEAAA